MATKKALTRADLEKVARPREQVELHAATDGVEGVVWVQGLLAGERDKYEGEIMRRDRKTGQLVPNLTNARALLIAISLVNEDGSPMFREDELGELKNLPARTLQHIWEKAAELSGLSESDVDELEADFGTARSNGSSTGSPGTSESPQKSSQSGLRAAN